MRAVKGVIYGIEFSFFPAVGSSGGDFNLFLDPEEKLGFSLNHSLIASFRSFVFAAELVDLPLLGGKFIWGNNHDPPTFVRLDLSWYCGDFVR
ncbi:hypothetical protein V6N11_064892 [Hibiscus sabdariffa]|uniref:Uncharacterized protein n=1 Tax=Hibiscus sabdariffa TaxID=183260 RepID=A0ABR2SIB0_9ROSI